MPQQLMKPDAIVQISKIKTEFFVREQLNDELVAQYRDQMAHGTVFPPILVTQEEEPVGVDGRHRLEAARQLGRETIEVVFTKPKPKLDLMMEAIRANMGGSLPPTRGDFILVIRHLLESGASGADIQDKFKRIVPAGLVRTYVTEARKLNGHAKLRAAANDVRHNDVPTKEAAEKHGVKLDDLKEELGDRRRKQKAFDPTGMKEEISGAYRGASVAAGHALKKLREMMVDGDASWEQVEEVFDKIEQLQKTQRRTMRNQRARFAQAAGKPFNPKTGEIIEEEESE